VRKKPSGLGRLHTGHKKCVAQVSKTYKVGKAIAIDERQLTPSLPEKQAEAVGGRSLLVKPESSVQLVPKARGRKERWVVWGWE